MKSKFYDERYSLEVYVDCDENPSTGRGEAAIDGESDS